MFNFGYLLFITWKKDLSHSKFLLMIYLSETEISFVKSFQKHVKELITLKVVEFLNFCPLLVTVIGFLLNFLLCAFVVVKL